MSKIYIDDNYRKGYDDSDVAKALAIQMALPHLKTGWHMPFRRSPQYMSNVGTARNFLRRRSIVFEVPHEEIIIPLDGHKYTP